MTKIGPKLKMTTDVIWKTSQGTIQSLLLNGMRPQIRSPLQMIPTMKMTIQTARKASYKLPSDRRMSIF